MKPCEIMNIRNCFRWEESCLLCNIQGAMLSGSGLCSFEKQSHMDDVLVIMLYLLLRWYNAADFIYLFISYRSSLIPPYYNK